MQKYKVLWFGVLLVVMMLGGCSTQASRASYNLAQEADSFNVVRQVTVINCFTMDTLFQMTGKISITKDNSDNQLEVVIEDEYGRYQKGIIGLNDFVTYTVNDLQVTNVENYKYTINYNPKMWMPIEFETID